ncbi:hypothetical protein ACFUTR_23290 [Streptomyces sp. NPDC057367]|uniref:hypothetical protein n=1 Tax=Streptomyces sp. NPDC057367 TaxID=3346108 RepID=UPI00363F3EE0
MALNVAEVAFVDGAGNVTIYTASAVQGQTQFETARIEITPEGVRFEHDAGGGTMRRLLVPWSNVLGVDQVV